MLLRFLIIAFLVCRLPVTFGQGQKALGSLIELEKNYEREDTVKVDLLNSISITYFPLSPDKTMEYARKATVSGERIGAYRQLAHSYNTIGFI